MCVNVFSSLSPSYNLKGGIYNNTVIEVLYVFQHLFKDAKRTSYFLLVIYSVHNSQPHSQTQYIK